MELITRPTRHDKGYPCVREASSRGAIWLKIIACLPMREIFLAITRPYIRQCQPICSHHRTANVKCEISHFPASVHESLQPDIAHLCCGQLTAVKTVYPQSSIT